MTRPLREIRSLRYVGAHADDFPSEHPVRESDFEIDNSNVLNDAGVVATDAWHELVYDPEPEALRPLDAQPAFSGGQSGTSRQSMLEPTSTLTSRCTYPSSEDPTSRSGYAICVYCRVRKVQCRFSIQSSTCDNCYNRKNVCIGADFMQAVNAGPLDYFIQLVHDDVPTPSIFDVRELSQWLVANKDYNLSMTHCGNTICELDLNVCQFRIKQALRTAPETLTFPQLIDHLNRQKITSRLGDKSDPRRLQSHWSECVTNESHLSTMMRDLKFFPTGAKFALIAKDDTGGAWQLSSTNRQEQRGIISAYWVARIVSYMLERSFFQKLHSDIGYKRSADFSTVANTLLSLRWRLRSCDLMFSQTSWHGYLDEKLAEHTQRLMQICQTIYLYYCWYRQHPRWKDIDVNSQQEPLVENALSNAYLLLKMSDDASEEGFRSWLKAGDELVNSIGPHPQY